MELPLSKFDHKCECCRVQHLCQTRKAEIGRRRVNQNTVICRRPVEINFIFDNNLQKFKNISEQSTRLMVFILSKHNKHLITADFINIKQSLTSN